MGIFNDVDVMCAVVNASWGGHRPGLGRRGSCVGFCHSWDVIAGTASCMWSLRPPVGEDVADQCCCGDLGGKRRADCRRNVSLPSHFGEGRAYNSGIAAGFNHHTRLVTVAVSRVGSFHAGAASRWRHAGANVSLWSRGGSNWGGDRDVLIF